MRYHPSLAIAILVGATNAAPIAEEFEEHSLVKRSGATTVSLPSSNVFQSGDKFTTLSRSHVPKLYLAHIDSAFAKITALAKNQNTKQDARSIAELQRIVAELKATCSTPYNDAEVVAINLERSLVATVAIEQTYANDISQAYADLIWLGLHLADRLAYKIETPLRHKEAAAATLISEAQIVMHTLMKSQQTRLAKQAASGVDQKSFQDLVASTQTGYHIADAEAFLIAQAKSYLTQLRQVSKNVDLVDVVAQVESAIACLEAFYKIAAPTASGIDPSTEPAQEVKNSAEYWSSESPEFMNRHKDLAFASLTLLRQLSAQKDNAPIISSSNAQDHLKWDTTTGGLNGAIVALEEIYTESKLRQFKISFPSSQRAIDYSWKGVAPEAYNYIEEASYENHNAWKQDVVVKADNVKSDYYQKCDGGQCTYPAPAPKDNGGMLATTPAHRRPHPSKPDEKKDGPAPPPDSPPSPPSARVAALVTPASSPAIAPAPATAPAANNAAPSDHSSVISVSDDSAAPTVVPTAPALFIATIASDESDHSSEAAASDASAAPIIALIAPVTPIADSKASASVSPAPATIIPAVVIDASTSDDNVKPAAAPITPAVDPIIPNDDATVVVPGPAFASPSDASAASALNDAMAAPKDDSSALASVKDADDNSAIAASPIVSSSAAANPIEVIIPDSPAAADSDDDDKAIESVAPEVVIPAVVVVAQAVAAEEEKEPEVISAPGGPSSALDDDEIDDDARIVNGAIVVPRVNTEIPKAVPGRSFMAGAVAKLGSLLNFKTIPPPDSSSSSASSAATVTPDKVDDAPGKAVRRTDDGDQPEPGASPVVAAARSGPSPIPAKAPATPAKKGFNANPRQVQRGGAKKAESSGDQFARGKIERDARTAAAAAVVAAAAAAAAAAKP